MKDIIEINNLIEYLSIFKGYQFDDKFESTLMLLNDVKQIGSLLLNINENAINLLQLMESNSDLNIKVEILSIFYISNYSNNKKIFNKYIKSKIDIVSFFSIWFLFKSEGIRSIQILLEIYYSTSNENTKKLLLYIFSKLNDSIVNNILLEALENETHRPLIYKHIYGSNHQEIGNYIMNNIMNYQGDILANAIAALGKIDYKVSEDRLIPYLDDIYFPIIKSTVDTLSIIGSVKSLEIIIDKLSSGEIFYDSIENAIITLGKKCKDYVISLVKKGLNEKNKIIIIQLAGDLKLKEIANDMLKFLETDKDDIIIIEEILIALKKIGSRDIIPHFLEGLADDLSDKNMYFVETIIDLLVKIKDSRTVVKLIEILKKDNQFLNERSIEALGKIADPLSLDAIFDVLKKHPNYVPIVQKAVDNFGKGSEDLLIEYLFDENENIRYVISKTLGRFNPLLVEMPLIKVFEEDHSIDVRASCARSLGLVHSKNSVNTLISHINGNPLLTRSIIFALGNIKDKKSSAKIQNLLDSSNKEIVIEAIEALEKIGDENSVPKLIEIKNKYKNEKSLFKLIEKSIISINSKNLIN